MGKLGVLVVSSDRYIGPWAPVWWACWKAYACPAEILFATTRVRVDLPHFATGEEGWSRRVLCALAEFERQSRPEFVILSLEDLLVGPREPGAYERDIGRCMGILRQDPRILSISLVRKDPELRPYAHWPELLGVQDCAPGIVSLAIAVWALYKPHILRQYLERTLAAIHPDADLGRNGAAEFEQKTRLFAEEAHARGDLHLCTRREAAQESPVNWLAGIGATNGHLLIQSTHDLAHVDAALAKSGHAGGLLRMPGLLDAFPLQWDCPTMD